MGNITQYAVKIVIWSGYQYREETIYYRNRLSLDLINRWRWYFDFLVAKVKIHCPRRKVELIICPQDLLQGREYVEQKTKTLLRAKRSRLARLEKETVKDDLFAFASDEHSNKINNLKKDIEDLENGIFRYYIPKEYINKIKIHTLCQGT